MSDVLVEHYHLNQSPDMIKREVWNILKTVYFWSYLEMSCIVLDTIDTISKHILLYNATSFVTIASFRAEILPFGGGRVRK